MNSETKNTVSSEVLRLQQKSKKSYNKILLHLSRIADLKEYDSFKENYTPKVFDCKSLNEIIELRDEMKQVKKILTSLFIHSDAKKLAIEKDYSDLLFLLISVAKRIDVNKSLLNVMECNTQ
jgi:hypothetical protein